MPSCYTPLPRAATRIVTAFLVTALVLASASQVSAQVQTTALNTRAVGGVAIDPAGLITNAALDDLAQLQKLRQEVLGDVPAGLNQATDTRKISLRMLDDAIRQARDTGGEIPAEIQYLGGLQQIRYVVASPEKNDIVLVGPAEGWKINQRGFPVGLTTGRPVMLLDDLIVALRAAAGPQRHVITCSIDPTPDGLQRLSAHAKTLRTIGNPQATAAGIEQVLGPQAVSVTGVPETSHFARVLVAADYRMKRISMETEPAPIRGLPGFMGMMRTGGRGMRNMLPRWWLAPGYDPILRDADGLTWELRGASVQTLTENDYLDASGTRRQTGDADPASKKWAALLTERYDDLAMAEPIFGQLQNCMDLAIVAALIVGEDLTGKAQVRLPMLLDAGGLPADEFNAPRQVESKATLAKKGRNWMIACGGVEINAWAMVQKAEQSDSLGAVRGKAALQDGNRWWE